MSKKASLRASQHSGREGSGRHNDRSFLTGRSAAWIQEHADHIDTTRTSENQVITWDHQTDIERSERAWYAQTYGPAQEETNRRYVRERHPDRCKTTDDLYEGRLTRPEEMILQVGSKDARADVVAFIDAYQAYQVRLEAWNRAHGGHMHILSMALHMDETTPHIHIRRVWDYQDRDGLTRLGQAKALEQAGIELPDPTKPAGRYNNRKMTFDALARGWWQEACRAHGLEIETEPLPDRRHKAKADYIRDQMAQEIDDLTTDRDRLQAERHELLCERDGAARQAADARHTCGQVSQEVDALTAQRDALRIEADQLAQDTKKARQRALQASQEAQKLQAERDEISRQTDQARETWTQAVKVARDASTRADAVSQHVDQVTGDLKRLMAKRDTLQAQVDELTLTKAMSDIPENSAITRIEAEAKPSLFDKDRITLSRTGYECLLTWSKAAWRDRKAREASQQELVYAQGRAREASEAKGFRSISDHLASIEAREALARYQAMERAHPDVFRQMDQIQTRKAWTRELESDRGDDLTR